MGKVSREIRTVKRQLMLEEWEKQVIDCRSSGRLPFKRSDGTGMVQAERSE